MGNSSVITADFIGGPWDGKTHDIPFVSEWRVAVIPITRYRFINKQAEENVRYDIATYKYIGHGIYWFSKLENSEQ